MAYQIGYQFWGPSLLWNERAAQAAYDSDIGEVPVESQAKRHLGPALPSHPATRTSHRRDVYIHVGGHDHSQPKNRLVGEDTKSDPDVATSLRVAVGPFHELSTLITDLTRHVVTEGRKGLTQNDLAMIERYRKNDSALTSARLAREKLFAGDSKGASQALIHASRECQDTALQARLLSVANKITPESKKAVVATMDSHGDLLAQKITNDVAPHHQKKCLELLAEAQRTQAKNKWQALHAYIKRHEPFAYQLMEEIEEVMKITRPL